MLSLNSFRGAGLAMLALAGSGLGASAADMMSPPPPPPMMPPPALESTSGFYLRGDIGVGLYDHSRIVTLPPVVGLSTLSSSVNGTAFVGVGAGYQVNSFLRGDITAEYRFHTKHRHVDVFTPPQSNLITGTVGGFVGLANAYVDLGTWHRITPFLGAGIGFASMTMGRTNDYQLNAGGALNGTGPSKTQTRMAWALHAGFGYDLTANLKAEVAYRYLHIGNVDGGRVTCAGACPYNVRIRGLASHDVKVGLRYMFADAAPSFMPGPLVRKY
ncbi:MAG: outer membrane beta-barrel protein [Proteobacteria bacterium]|nr:outer membrane beta-barrel protein [Pseudomonadota bacterium]